MFDEALRAYNYQKATNAFSFEILNGREVFMSDYKICKYRSHGIPYETITFKLEEYNKTVDLFLIVRERHRELVNAIKSVIPDFDFSGENA